MYSKSLTSIRQWKAKQSERQPTASINRPIRPSIHFRRHRTTMSTLHIPSEPFRQINLTEYRIRTHVRLYNHTMRSHSLNRRLGEDMARPRPRRQYNVRCGKSMYMFRLFIFIRHGFHTVRSCIVDCRHGTENDFRAGGDSQVGHGGGEEVRVDLGCCRGRAHFRVAFYTVRIEPVEIFWYAVLRHSFIFRLGKFLPVFSSRPIMNPVYFGIGSRLAAVIFSLRAQGSAMYGSVSPSFCAIVFFCELGVEFVG